MMNRYLMLGILLLALGSFAKADDPSPKVAREPMSPSSRLAFSKVLGLANEITLPDDRALALRQIARAQASVGDNKAAQQTFALAISLVDHLPLAETRSSIPILEMIGFDQQASGDRSGAIASYRKAVELVIAQPSKEGFFNRYGCYYIIRAQMRSGDRAGARETFEKARQAMANAKNKSLDHEIRLWIAELQALLGDYDAAFQAITAYEANPNPPIADFKLHALDAIRSGVMIQINPAGGHAVLERILRESTANKDIDATSLENFLYQFSHTAVTTGAFDLAFNAIDAMKDDPSQPILVRNKSRSSRSGILASIAKAQAKAGHRDQANATLGRAKLLVETLDVDMSRALGLRSIQAAQIEMGDFAEVLLPIGRDIRPIGHEERLSSLKGKRQVARILEKAGDVEAARKIRTQALAEAELLLRDLKFRTTPPIPGDPGPTFTTYEWGMDGTSLEVVALKADLGNFDSALALAQTIKTDFPRQQALREVATAQGRTGDVDAPASWIRRLKAPRDRYMCILGLASGVGERYSPNEPEGKSKR